MEGIVVILKSIFYFCCKDDKIGIDSAYCAPDRRKPEKKKERNI